MRYYLRHRAGLPPLVVGAGALNHGHQLLFERELHILHDVLPRDSEIHDGLQLVDGGSPTGTSCYLLKLRLQPKSCLVLRLQPKSFLVLRLQPKSFLVLLPRLLVPYFLRSLVRSLQMLYCPPRRTPCAWSHSHPT